VSEIVLHRISETEVVAFGQSTDLDLLGTAKQQAQPEGQDGPRKNPVP
jgi:hypothetical protein